MADLNAALVQQVVIVGVSAAVADGRPIRADHGTPPPLAQIVALHEGRDGAAWRRASPLSREETLA